MKKLLFTSLFIFIFLFAGCSEDEDNPVTPTPTPTTGTIGGVISLPVGAGGDITNTRVAIYQSYDDWLNDRVLTSCACASGGAYSFANVTPGTYYLDGWKDNNNNLIIDTGDFFGVYGSGTYPNFTVSPFSVAAGQTTAINATIFVVP
jgi:hypothetical protein